VSFFEALEGARISNQVNKKEACLDPRGESWIYEELTMSSVPSFSLYRLERLFGYSPLLIDPPLGLRPKSRSGPYEWRERLCSGGVWPPFRASLRSFPPSRLAFLLVQLVDLPADALEPLERHSSLAHHLLGLFSCFFRRFVFLSGSSRDPLGFAQALRRPPGRTQWLQTGEPSSFTFFCSSTFPRAAFFSSRK